MNNIASQGTAETAKKPVALIAGPTASGKSALAVRLAEIADGIVINADASQVYADLRVLSARPSEEEEARAPHRLFGYRDAATSCSAADWAADAKAEIASAHEAGKLPILVGGTGLYLRTLLFGIAPIPEIDPETREKVRGLRVDAAYRALLKEDPAMAALLRQTDTTRVARALEVMRSTGKSILVWREQLEGGILDQISAVTAILLPPRESLYDRINRRFEAMLDEGAIEEVLGLRARHLDPELPAMRAIGVRDIIAWRNGEIDYDTMLAQSQAASRQYAKRQYTWFRHQLPTEWPRLNAQLNDVKIEEIAIKLHEQALTA